MPLEPPDLPPPPEQSFSHPGAPLQMPKEKWPDVIQDIFPAGQVHLIGGASRAGKTALECWMASHILNGSDFLGHHTTLPVWWGCLILDRASEDRRLWWERAGIGGRIPFYCLTEDPRMSPAQLQAMTYAQSWAWLDRCIRDMKPLPGGVLTIDVVSFFVPDFRQGYQKAFAQGWSLSKIAHDMELTIFALLHGGKQSTGDRYIRLTDRIIAPMGFLGSVGTVSYLTSEAESGGKGFQEYEWESHQHPTERFKLFRTANGLYRVAGEVAVLKPADKVTRDDYLPLIPPEGSDGYAKTADLLRRIGSLWKFSESKITHDLMKLEAEGKILKFQGTKGKWQKRRGLEQPEPAGFTVQEEMPPQ